MMQSSRFARAMVCVCVAVAGLAAGCNDNDLGLERRRPNRAPETILSSSPPDSTYDTVYQVQLFWSGADADGTIDHFDFILVDHPAEDDSIDSAEGDPNRVRVEIPAADDPRWVATASNDTLIVSRADTLRRDPRPPAGSSDSEVREHYRLVRLQNFERWHTFFIRAVDNEGEIDPTPEYVSFNSTTLAPDVALSLPVDPVASEFRGPRVIVFNWTGSDPIGDGSFIDPIASRWVIIPTTKDFQSRYVGYPGRLHDVPFTENNVRYDWSIWRRWDAADGSGKRAIITGLDPVDGMGRGWYLFAVQGMDEAGAVTPVFDAHTNGKNNVAKVFVLDQFGATLIVEEPFLGQFTFVGLSRPRPVAVATGQPIQFRWRGDAMSYGGSIVAYRYGWNLLNPERDEEWDQNWCETCTTAPARVFNSGTQRFFLETRDNAGTVTHAELELTVYQVTRRRDLLIVDDTDNFPDDPLNQEVLEDDRWRSIVESLQQIQPFGFDARPGADIYDVAGTFREAPPISKVFDYKTVVWYSKIAGNGNVALRELAAFFDPFVDRNRDRVVKFNYLATYVENGGEFWLSGSQPTTYLWTFAPNQTQLYPFNVTNWDDPIMPHPGEDSVGVRSFLWRMGAEAVDQGGGGQAPRIREMPAHFCLGFRRATPQGYDRQSFESSSAEDHQHTVDVLTADVDAPPASPVTYTTTSASGTPHTHTVTLTPEELSDLARGQQVSVETSEATLPSPHTHVYDFIDRIGLWGAPAQLDPERGNWAQPADPILNPGGGRPAIEIYNMPAFFSSQPVRLNPDPLIWETLYTYRSATPADPTNGVLYPQTADGQPAIILRKASPFDTYYSRALCGFEIWRLQRASHLALADFILLRHFRLGLPDG